MKLYKHTKHSQQREREEIFKEQKVTCLKKRSSRSSAGKSRESAHGYNLTHMFGLLKPDPLLTPVATSRPTNPKD